MTSVPSSDFRVCPESGLRIHRPAQALMKANAVAAVLSLAIGGIFAFLVAMTRWPTVHLLPADWFYLSLTGHGLNMLIFWIIFFEMAVLYFCSSTLLGCRLATPRWGWAGFGLMVVGAIMTNWAVLRGRSSVMMTSYVPMSAEPWFYLGIILFAVGALIGTFIFFGTLVIAKDEKTYEGSVPLVTFGATTAALIAVFTIATGAIILVPTFLWSIGYISHIDPLMYRTIWWALGHSSQQINVATHISIWYAIAAIVFGAKPMSEKVSRSMFMLYILFLQLASVHHLLVDPGVSSEWKIFNTSYAMYLAVLASMVHGLTVPGCIEVAQRKKGYNKGLFEWIRKAPWGNPVFSGMFLSLIMFGFLGGITGVVMGVEQIAIIIHNTIYVPGHFHGTVVTGTTLAFMAITYWLIPVIFQRKLILPTLAKWQPYLFGLSMGVFAIVMMGAGTLGVPRRHWDMSFSGMPLGYEFPGLAYLMMGIVGVAAIVAVIGGIAYIVITVGSILFGEKVTATAAKPAPAPAPAHNVGHGNIGMAGFHAPGTFVLALVFLASLVLYYFVNWKYLSGVWGLS